MWAAEAAQHVDRPQLLQHIWNLGSTLTPPQGPGVWEGVS